MHSYRRHRPGPVAGLVAGILVLAGCSGADTSAGREADTGISIVAATNVYGDVAASVAGELAEVTSIITHGGQDPHSYEASAQDQLALSKADLVIENGGGYDPFIDQLLDASGSEAVVVSAAEVSGLLDQEQNNEHVWYSLHGVELLANEIAHQLGELDPANAAAYEANYQSFAQEIAGLEDRAAEVGASAAGKGVAITEPVPVYLLEAVGLQNLTPDAFSEAVEEGRDIPPLALRDTLALLEADAVSLLAYNEQTAGPQTEQLLQAARTTDIPVVSFAETLPADHDYISWMADNLAAIEAALS